MAYGQQSAAADRPVLCRLDAGDRAYQQLGFKGSCQLLMAVALQDGEAVPGVRLSATGAHTSVQKHKGTGLRWNAPADDVGAGVALQYGGAVPGMRPAGSELDAT